MSIKNINPAEPHTEAIRASIFGKQYIQIDTVRNGVPWNQEVHAVNWFNTRSALLYNYYNKIAGRCVKKVGGKPVFKGRLTKHLIGGEQDLRTVLLVVKYPSPIHFQKMLGNAYFQIVSLVRSIAVKQFTFCLTERVSGINQAPADTDSCSYAVHHFRGNSRVIDLVQDVSHDTNVELVFASVKTHRLKSVNSKDEATPIPDIMDGIILLRASDSSILECLVQSKKYQVLVEQNRLVFNQFV